MSYKQREVTTSPEETWVAPGTGETRAGEEPHDDFTVPQKASYVTNWKDNQSAVYWVRLSEAQDQGLEFWQTKSFAIMTYATIPGDCIDRVERVDFERLETPRPVPKVTLKKNWQSQGGGEENPPKSV